MVVIVVNSAELIKHFEVICSGSAHILFWLHMGAFAPGYKTKKVSKSNMLFEIFG